MTTTSTTWETPPSPEQTRCPKCGAPMNNTAGVHGLIRARAGVLIDCTGKPYREEAKP